MDYNSGISYATKKGLEQGEKKKAIETAKKMKSKNMPIELIAEITELAKEEIEQI